MAGGVSAQDLDRLRAALASHKLVSGKTHSFYLYPARFHPDVAREAIQLFSPPDGLVFDPFMGGGTTVVEALALGRRVVGVDINTLAHFVADVRTTPLSRRDEFAVMAWAEGCQVLAEGAAGGEGVGAMRLPRGIASFLAGARRRAAALPYARQRAFARCALLRLGQFALDTGSWNWFVPRRSWLAARLPEIVAEMVAGMRELVDVCRGLGIPKDGIRRRRELVNRTVIGIDEDPVLAGRAERPSLVLTSPPYPGVHVLYHRWQFRGRRETPAPYVIAGLKDGCGPSYYTMGDRKPFGVEKYFKNIVAAFRSVRAVIADDAWVVQVVGFGDTAAQLPRYLAAMEAAGFTEWGGGGGLADRISRSVPNRRWYKKNIPSLSPSSELLLIHRPAWPMSSA